MNIYLPKRSLGVGIPNRGFEVKCLEKSLGVIQGISNIPIHYISQYPPAYNNTYVKATTELGTGRQSPHYATNPTRPLTGNAQTRAWLSAVLTVTDQRFHIDLGSAKVITRIYYENLHSSGLNTTGGVQNFTFWGSNTVGAFIKLTYATDTNWTQITSAQATFDEHTASDVADPKYITVTNTTAYRYYAFKFADNYGSAGYMGVRRIELQVNVN